MPVDEILERLTKLIADLKARRDFLSIDVERLREQQGHLSQAVALFTQAIAEVQAASALIEEFRSQEESLPAPVDVEPPEITLRPEGIAEVFIKEHGLRFTPDYAEAYVDAWFNINFERFGFATLGSPHARESRSKVLELVLAEKARVAEKRAAIREEGIAAASVKTNVDVPLAQPKRRGRPPKNGPIDRRDILVRAGRGEGIREIARKTGHHHSTIKQVLDEVQSGVADVGKAPTLEADDARSIRAPGNHTVVAPLGMSTIAAPIPPARLQVPKRQKDPGALVAGPVVPPIPNGIDWSFELRCDSVLARVCRVLAEGGPKSITDLARGLRCAVPAVEGAIARLTQLGGYLNRLPNGNVALNTRIPGVNDQAAVR